MTKSQPSAKQPTPREVRAALDRIVTSEIFRPSRQLTAFLSFVVEATLAGKVDRIKGYTIGVEVLKRNENFDPQIDPIVRVEATRLRRALERYYTGDGADDRVQIEIGRGSYIPAFYYRPTQSLASPRRTSRTDVAFQAVNGMPTLFVNPFDAINAPGKNAISTNTLREKICDASARFDTINVVSNAGTAIGPDRGYNYLLMGSLEYVGEDTAHARLRLLDADQGLIIWSRTFESSAIHVAREVAEDEIVIDLSTTLFQPFGVIRANELVHRFTRGVGDPRNLCIIEASESFRSFDPDQHARARACLERLTSAAAPGFADGYAYLAGIYLREFQFGYAGQGGDPAILDRALELVRKAIELRPQSSRAHHILFVVLFARREIQAAFAARDEAMALNRYDLTVKSDYGGRLIMIGEVERGMEMLRETGIFGSIRPSWHHFYMFLGNYLRGDLIDTIHHANQITAKDYTLGLMARVLAAAAAGDRKRAIEAFGRLKAISPAWATNPRGELDRFFPVADIAQRLACDLHKAVGLAEG